MKEDHYTAALKSQEKLWKSKIDKDLKGKKEWQDYIYSIVDSFGINPFIHGMDNPSFFSQEANSSAQWQSVIDIRDLDSINIAVVDRLGIDVVISDSQGTEDMNVAVWRPAEESQFPASMSEFSFVTNSAMEYSHILLTKKIKNTSPIAQLSGTLELLDNAFNEILENGLAELLNETKLVISLQLSDRFYDNIALIRALRILIDEMTTSWSIPEQDISIQAFLMTESWDKSLQHNQISMTTQTLAAAIGGAEYISMPPLSKIPEHLNTSLRMSANVHHILRMESHLSYVNNMIEGSYFLDELATTFAQEAWSNFIANHEDFNL